MIIYEWAKKKKNPWWTCIFFGFVLFCFVKAWSPRHVSWLHSNSNQFLYFIPMMNLQNQSIRRMGMRKVWESSRDSLFHSYLPETSACLICVWRNLKKKKKKSQKEKEQKTQNHAVSYRTELNSLFCYFKALWALTQTCLFNFISRYIFSHWVPRSVEMPPLSQPTTFVSASMGWGPAPAPPRAHLSYLWAMS